LGLPHFEQYVIAKSYGLESVGSENEKFVIQGFEKFCATHLQKLVAGYPDAGPLVNRLARERYSSWSPRVGGVLLPLDLPLGVPVLPSKLEENFQSPEMKVAIDGLSASSGVSAWKSVKGDSSVHKALKVYYFEVTFGGYTPPQFCLLTSRQPSCCVIGFCTSKAKLDGYLGSGSGSWGLELNGVTLPGGEKYGTQVPATGDVVGCCINLHKKTAFFTINGKQGPPAFSGLELGSNVYPAVSLVADGTLKCNFGQTEFKFNLAEYVKVTQSFFNAKLVERVWKRLKLSRYL
jgi:hypothetical protein